MALFSQLRLIRMSKTNLSGLLSSQPESRMVPLCYNISCVRALKCGSKSSNLFKPVNSKMHCFGAQLQKAFNNCCQFYRKNLHCGSLNQNGHELNGRLNHCTCKRLLSSNSSLASGRSNGILSSVKYRTNLASGSKGGDVQRLINLARPEWKKLLGIL